MVPMNRWFRYRFRIELEENGSTRWWIDILILDTVIRQVLLHHRAGINLWRVHRRSKTDETGHQFTFLVYASEEIANQINQEIQSLNFFKTLKTLKLLKDYPLDEESACDIHLIEGTSDESWSPVVQKSWPYYIMGVSEMLLALVGGLKEGLAVPKPSDELAAIEGFYRRLNNRLSEVWQNEGRHAFLHHINALFGYHPIAVPRTMSGNLVTF